MHLSYNPATTLPDIYPRKMNTCIYTKNCAWMYLAGLYVQKPKVGNNLKDPQQVNG